MTRRSSPSLRAALHAGAAVLMLGLGACHSAPEQSLRGATIPASFTFANSRGVAITVSAAASALPGGSGTLEIALADGRVLYRGTATAQRPSAFRLPVPLKDDRLVATLSAGGSVSRIQLPISSGAASGSFQ